MTLTLDKINNVLGSLNQNIEATAIGLNDLVDNRIAARFTNLGSEVGEIISGIQAITSEFDEHSQIQDFFGHNLASITEDIPGLSQDLLEQTDEYRADLDALEGGTSTDGFLHEIITMGSTEAINSVLSTITSLDFEQVLKDIALEAVSSRVMEGIQQFDTTLGGVNRILGQISTIRAQLEAVIPTIAGAVVDDLVLNIDPDINDTILDLTRGYPMLEDDRVQILRDLAAGNLDRAANLIRTITRGEGLGVDAILGRLSDLEVRVPWIISDGSVAGRDDAIDLTSPPSYSYVDSVEEFEDGLRSSSRDLVSFVVHMIPDLSSNDYHYAIDPNGRVVRGISLNSEISSMGFNETGDLHIAIVGGVRSDGVENSAGSLTSPQIRSVRFLLVAMRAVVPGTIPIAYGVRDPAAPSINFNPEAIQ